METRVSSTTRWLAGDHDPRGSALLLDHCRRLEELMRGDRPPARERLERLVGPKLSAGLVRALSGDHRLVSPRWADRLGEAL
jgi:hypothetical protein